MPLSGGKYVAPHWVNEGPPALDAAELNAISQTLAQMGNVASPAQQLGLTGDLSVGASLGVLAKVGDLHVWRRTKSGVVDYPVSTNRNAYQDGSDERPAGYTLGELETGKFFLTAESGATHSISYRAGKSISVLENGSVSFPDVGTSNFIANQNRDNITQCSVAKGKFICATDVYSGSVGAFPLNSVYFIPADAEIVAGPYNCPYVTKRQKVTSYAATPATAATIYLGRFGNKGKVVSGSYYGTGTSGPGGANVLKFETKPKFIIVLQTGTYCFGILLDGYGKCQKGGNTYNITASLGTTATWYASSNTEQLNEKSSYKYIAYCGD